MHTIGSATIDRPIDEVFRAVNEDVAKWSTIVVSDELVEDKNNGGVGTTFRTVTEEHGQPMEFHGVVTAHDPPRKLSIELSGKMFNLTVDYLFEDLGGKTKVTQDSTAQGKGIYRLMLPIMGVIMRKQSCEAVNRELNNLKTYCEDSQSPQPS